MFTFIFILQPLPPSGMGSGFNVTWGIISCNFTQKKKIRQSASMCVQKEVRWSVCVCVTMTQCVCKCECGEQLKEELKPVMGFVVGPFVCVVN
jgi:hypothetical protein